MFLTQLTKPHLTPRRRQGCQVILRAWLCCSSLHGNVVDSLVPRPHPHALDSAQDDQTGEKTAKVRKDMLVMFENKWLVYVGIIHQKMLVKQCHEPAIF